MNLNPHSRQDVLVVGAGIMGAGIAQVAAQAGHAVQLFDSRGGAAAQAVTQLAGTLQNLVAKGRLRLEEAQATLGRVQPIDALDQAQGAALVVEAIVENLDAKRSLLRQLEGVVGAGCVLATNTSSISVTALAQGLAHPGRLVGMHFFNPVPLMKLVEVVSGLHTDAAVAQAIFELSRQWGKVPVHARSTPGFIVNRIARPYYAEALALLQEQVAGPPVLDACLRGAGFRMGPCELMDLIGHDTNLAVTRTVFEANFFDARYRPSVLQQEMVDGGLLGRKSGRGFYEHTLGMPSLPRLEAGPPASTGTLTVHGTGPMAERLALAAAGARREPGSRWVGLQADALHLVQTDGRSAQALARVLGTAEVAVFDHVPGSAPAAAVPPPLAWACADAAGAQSREQAAAWLAAMGHHPLQVADSPGLIVARTLAMLINEASDAVQQGVCTEAGADAAMKLGVNYPAGPFEWLAGWGAGPVVHLLDALAEHYRGERYRVSPRLRRAA